MQFTFPALVKLSVFAVMANTVAVVALPEPVGLEARQLSCLGKLCTPGVADGCCTGAACTGVDLLGLPAFGVCTPSICDIICSETVPCCADVGNTTFTCQLIPGQTVGVCIPGVIQGHGN